jgi:hypothetical protein
MPTHHPHNADHRGDFSAPSLRRRAPVQWLKAAVAVGLALYGLYGESFEYAVLGAAGLVFSRSADASVHYLFWGAVLSSAFLLFGV